MKSVKQKRDEANARSLERFKRTALQQIELLKTRPGEHKKELARLSKQVGASCNPG